VPNIPAEIYEKIEEKKEIYLPLWQFSAGFLWIWKLLKKKKGNEKLIRKKIELEKENGRIADLE